MLIMPSIQRLPTPLSFSADIYEHWRIILPELSTEAVYQLGDTPTPLSVGVDWKEFGGDSPRLMTAYLVRGAPFMSFTCEFHLPVCFLGPCLLENMNMVLPQLPVPHSYSAHHIHLRVCCCLCLHGSCLCCTANMHVWR